MKVHQQGSLEGLQMYVYYSFTGGNNQRDLPKLRHGINKITVLLTVTEPVFGINSRYNISPSTLTCQLTVLQCASLS